MILENLKMCKGLDNLRRRDLSDVTKTYVVSCYFALPLHFALYECTGQWLSSMDLLLPRVHIRIIYHCVSGVTQQNMTRVLLSDCGEISLKS